MVPIYRKVCFYMTSHLTGLSSLYRESFSSYNSTFSNSLVKKLHLLIGKPS